MILPKKPHFLKLKIKFMGGRPNDDDRTCNGTSQIYLSVSHIYWLFRLTVSLSSSLILHRLIPNWLGCRNLSGQVCTLLQRRSARKGFSFRRLYFFFFLDKRLRVFIDICLMKVTLSKRTIQYFKDKLWTWLFFKWPFFLMWQHRRKGFCFYI